MNLGNSASHRTKFLSILFLLVALVVAGCGSGGGASTPTAAIPIVVTPGKGLMVGATVAVKGANNVQATGVTTLAGTATVELPSSASPPFIVSVSCPDTCQYFDEKSLTMVSGSSAMPAMLAAVPSTGNTSIGVTAATHAAAKYALAKSPVLTATSVSDANSQIVTTLGFPAGTNILTPPTIISDAASNASAKSGATSADVLANFSASIAVAANGVSALDAINDYGTAWANTASNPMSSVVIPGTISQPTLQAESPTLSLPTILPVTKQMGGARQGARLSLTELVTLTGNYFQLQNNISTGTAAEVPQPSNITTDGINLYLTEFHNHRIIKIEIATGTTTTIAGPDTAICMVSGGTCPSGYVDGTGTGARFSWPSGITTDGINLYVVDNNAGNDQINLSNNAVVRKVEIATGIVSTIARPHFVTAMGVTNIVTAAEAITTDGINVYFSDRYRIYKIDLATGGFSVFVGGGVATDPFLDYPVEGYADGIGRNALFFKVAGLTTDGTNLYVSDSFNHRIRKVVIATREVTTLAGGGGAGYKGSGTEDGIGTKAGFANPTEIASDGASLYVVDNVQYGGASDNTTIRKIEIATGIVTTLVGTNTTSVGTKGQFTLLPPDPRLPPVEVSSVTTDGKRLYVVGRNYSSIRTIQ